MVDQHKENIAHSETLMSSRIAARAPKLARRELLRDCMLINGQWQNTDSTFEVEDPATKAIIGSVAEGSRDQARAAIEAAQQAFLAFKNTTARSRSELLRRWAQSIRENQDDLTTILSWENGKPLAEARGEVLSCALTFEWFSESVPHYNGDTIPSQTPSMRLQTIRQPVGVCGIVTPWNFPASMIARKVGAALAAGCTTVIKPAHLTPYSALAMAYLAKEAGVPDGVVNVVTAAKHVREVGEEICTNKHVKKITFTGSTPIGKVLMGQAAGTIKKCSFELGGNAPFIVFEDANIDKAVEGAMASKFRGSGQTCICANRFYVHESVYDEFITQFQTKVKALKVGHAFDEGTTQGPVIGPASIEKVKRHVEDALGKGGELLAGGKQLTELGENFWAPTLIGNGNPRTMKVFSEETFGPLAVVAKFSTTEEVIELANDVDVGLAGYFFTENISKAYRVAEALEVGMVGVNTGLITEVALPFGGIKESGFGREQSSYGLDDYTILKTIATKIA